MATLDFATKPLARTFARKMTSAPRWRTTPHYFPFLNILQHQQPTPPSHLLFLPTSDLLPASTTPKPQHSELFHSDLITPNCKTSQHQQHTPSSHLVFFPRLILLTAATTPAMTNSILSLVLLLLMRHHHWIPPLTFLSPWSCSRQCNRSYCVRCLIWGTIMQRIHCDRACCSIITLFKELLVTLTDSCFPDSSNRLVAGVIATGTGPMFIVRRLLEPLSFFFFGIMLWQIGADCMVTMSTTYHTIPASFLFHYELILYECQPSTISYFWIFELNTAFAPKGQNLIVTIDTLSTIHTWSITLITENLTMKHMHQPHTALINLLPTMATN